MKVKLIKESTGEISFVGFGKLELRPIKVTDKGVDATFGQEATAIAVYLRPEQFAEHWFDLEPTVEGIVDGFRKIFESITNQSTIIFNHNSGKDEYVIASVDHIYYNIDINIEAVLTAFANIMELV
jgi:hypothetical protein